jgi:hypothetical protein
MINILKRLRGARETNPDTLKEKDIVSLVQKAYGEEFKRLKIENPDAKLARIGSENILFTEIPADEQANAIFMHRQHYYGPNWKEIHVEKRRDNTSNIFSLSHDALHALSADEGGASGMHEYDWTLQQWGYSGLDEAITDHFARHVIESQIVPRMSKRFAKAYAKRNESHAYSYLVTYLERVMRSVASATKDASESTEAAYIRTRDSIYRDFVAGNRKAILGVLHKYVAPGTGTLFAAVASPRRKVGTPGSVTKEQAETSLRSAEKVAASFSTKMPEGLIRVTYKPYLDVKNYPGYPDHVNEKFVAKVICDHHLHSLTGQFGETIVTDPVGFTFTDNAITAVLQQIAAIDQDLEIIKRNKLFQQQSQLSKLYELHTILSMIANYVSRDHQVIWRMIRKSAQAESNAPNLEELRAQGHKAVLASRNFNRFWTENMYTYLFNRVRGDSSVRLKI